MHKSNLEIYYKNHSLSELCSGSVGNKFILWAADPELARSEFSLRRPATLSQSKSLKANFSDI